MRLVTATMLVLSLSACKSKAADSAEAPTPTVPSETSDATTAAQPVFEEFVIKSFHWELQGYDVVVLRKEGLSSYVGAVPKLEKHKGEEVLIPTWNKIEWQADPDKIAKLIDMLSSQGFRDLEELYIDRSVEDGQSDEFILVDTQGKKRVQCSNSFPPEIQRIQKYISAEFVAPRQEELKSATPLSPADAKAHWAKY